MKSLFLSLFLVFFVAQAETEFAIPKPSLEHPRQFIFPLTSDNEAEISHVLSSASNVMKFYGPEKCEIIIVCYSKGIKTILAKSHFLNKDIPKRVRSLMTYDVGFVGCKNSMRTFGIVKKDLMKGVEIVTAGIVELIERQKSGWTYIRP